MNDAIIFVMLEKCKISCVICCNFRLDYSEWWRCEQWRW